MLSIMLAVDVAVAILILLLSSALSHHLKLLRFILHFLLYKFVDLFPQVMTHLEFVFLGLPFSLFDLCLLSLNPQLICLFDSIENQMNLVLELKVWGYGIDLLNVKRPLIPNLIVHFL